MSRDETPLDRMAAIDEVTAELERISDELEELDHLAALLERLERRREAVGRRRAELVQLVGDAYPTASAG